MKLDFRLHSIKYQLNSKERKQFNPYWTWEDGLGGGILTICSCTYLKIFLEVFIMQSHVFMNQPFISSFSKKYYVSYF